MDDRGFARHKSGREFFTTSMARTPTLAAQPLFYGLPSLEGGTMPFTRM
jgi:hypothetical protein